MTAAGRSRALEKITRLSGAGLDLVDFWRACAEPIASAVPHHWAPCFYTLDPDSSLITSHFQEGLERIPSDWLEAEYFDDDVHQLADIARSGVAVSILHEVTDGDPSGTPRWKRNIQLGGDQEAITALRTRTGQTWGAMSLYREPEQPKFDDTDKDFLRAAAPYLAKGVSHALLVGEALDPEGPDAPGLVVLDSALRVESMTPGVDRWLADLPDGDVDCGKLPSCVKSVGASALRGAASNGGLGPAAMVRIVGHSGRWIEVHATPLVSAGEPRVAVIIEPAHPARISSVLMSAYGLTDREKDVTRLALQGKSTADVADALVISPHTVQQHFKSIFDKTGARSRRDLAGKVFFAHYEPRLRDNEQRVLEDRPLRGGPMPTDG